MDLSKEEFDFRFKETLELIITQMAENPDVQVDKFYHMTYFLENLAFFSPVIFDLLQKTKP
ncbi:hypothetical protein GXP67_30090 [Rhodocytophaga rosea]|uniref:Uncharacterized protein n=2 Tax=Rhodocytophaga rosea TaxID=2704465 RepID=A0A6C0GVE3_9BACT|nr:hypothetical protein GXP67_30090 [Rhodocytophaga rosea]